MALEQPPELPLIIEPRAYPKSSSPSSLLNGSLRASSSLNSFNFSRPQSSCSNTSHSDVSPSPTENTKDVPLRDLTLPANSAPPEMDPQSPVSNLSPTALVNDEDQLPRTVPTNTSASSATTIDRPRSSLQWIRSKISERRWLETAIGAVGLATALWLGVRGYKLAVWQSWNDLRQLCSNYQQNDMKLGPRCSSLLKGDPPEPPYFFGNWGSSSATTASRLVKPRSMVPCKHLSACDLDIDTSAQLTLTALTIIAALALIVVGSLVQIGRRGTRTVPPFTNTARSEHSHIEITHHHESGPKTISGHGTIVKEKPEEEHVKHIQDEIRRSQDYSSVEEAKWHPSNASAETLVPPWKPSHPPSTSVSVVNHTANEKHEGLIELQVSGKAKAFFIPSTGEFIHLKPWKSMHNSVSDGDTNGDRNGAEEKGSLHKALGQMLVGGASGAMMKNEEMKMVDGLLTGGGEGVRRRRQPNDLSSGKPITA